VHGANDGSAAQALSIVDAVQRTMAGFRTFISLSKSVHFDENFFDAAVVPPIILFLLLLMLLALAHVWQRFGQPLWLRLPEHLRRGLTGLYLVVAVPWVAWYGYKVSDALRQDGYEPSSEVSDAFWSLLIVPIGGPILAFAVV
jgi:hypothetical protein